MPANIVKPGQEAAWEKAKERAKEQGKEEVWPYVAAIFKNMVGKTASRFNPTPDEEWVLRQVAKPARALYPDILKDAEGARVILDSYAKWHSHTIAATAYNAWQREQWGSVKPDYKFKTASPHNVAYRYLARTAYESEGLNPISKEFGHGKVTPLSAYHDQGSHTPPARDRDGKPIEVPKQGPLKIPGGGVQLGGARAPRPNVPPSG